MLSQVHQQFTDAIKQGRDNRLKDDSALFTGLFWMDVKAVDPGLANATGNSDFVTHSIIKASDVMDYAVKENFASRVARKLGAATGVGAVKALAAMGRLKLLTKE